MVQIEKSQCLLNREFPKFFKTHPTFIFRSNFKACRSLKPKGPVYLSALVDIFKVFIASKLMIGMLRLLRAMISEGEQPVLRTRH